MMHRDLRWILLSVVSASCDSSSLPGGPGPGDGGTRTDMGSSNPLCNTPPMDLSTSQRRARECPVGSEATLLLRGAPYTKIVIEVDATAGANPRQAAITHLMQVFADVTDKPGGISVVIGDSNIPASGHPLSLDEIRAMDDAHRKQFALGDTAVFYYLVVTDPSSLDTADFKILGLSYRPSSMVVFQGTIDQVSGGLGQPSGDVVESAVTAHELGHLLGLVNLSIPMQVPHDDAAHPPHDRNQNCLMYYANNSSMSLANLLGGGTVPDFDAQCRADLKAARDGK